MSDEIIATASATPAKTIAIGERGLQLSTLEDGWRFAQMVARSGFAPKGMSAPESILVAVQMGLEVGMSPMMALQNTAVINGRPAIYCDAALALVRGSGLLESYEQEINGDGDARVATVKCKRRGDPRPIVGRFSVRDAKSAQLWGKSGPWQQYPDRMLLFRARGFALRDAFGDVLRGLRTAEEAADIPPDEPTQKARVEIVDAAPDLPDLPDVQAETWRDKLQARIAAEALDAAEVEKLAHNLGHLPQKKTLADISERGARALVEANLAHLLAEVETVNAEDMI